MCRKGVGSSTSLIQLCASTSLITIHSNSCFCLYAHVYTSVVWPSFLWLAFLCHCRKAIPTGMLSGALGQFIASPTDLVKVRLQMEGRRILEGKAPRYNLPCCLMHC